MSATQQESRVTIVIKALPQPSKTHGETVCCAGITADGEWKRLFPVRFRHLNGDNSFKRWDWVTFRYRRPTRDARLESCHVFEDTISVNGNLKKDDRNRLIDRVLQSTIAGASLSGQSLAAIRPKNTRFYFNKKSMTAIASEKAAFLKAAQQTSFLDEELKALEPTPYDFRFTFEDDRPHDFSCGDWEAHAMFYRERKRTSEVEALRWMNEVFNEKYPAAGMVFTVGNIAARPQIWQLLGVLKIEEPDQPSFL